LDGEEPEQASAGRFTTKVTITTTGNSLEMVTDGYWDDVEMLPEVQSPDDFNRSPDACSQSAIQSALAPNAESASS
jgi:hypothetical protein